MNFGMMPQSILLKRTSDILVQNGYNYHRDHVNCYWTIRRRATLLEFEIAFNLHQTIIRKKLEKIGWINENNVFYSHPNKATLFTTDLGGFRWRARVNELS